MNKIILYISIMVIVLVVGFFLLNNYIYTQKQGNGGFPPAFGSPINFTVGQTVTLPDYADVTLVKINDSRCKQGVVCIWAGELSPEFIVTYGNELGENMQITLGTTNNKKITKNGYTFTLEKLTETTATII